jgi:hypothetical protein
MPSISERGAHMWRGAKAHLGLVGALGRRAQLIVRQNFHVRIHGVCFDRNPPAGSR